ncbi:MAG TPA: DUF4230 domain-containing protein [Thermoanaerobaculia bacterium]|nr:DUF4230 domain-containing protein [Thermoanaerobaculia bacterium]
MDQPSVSTPPHDEALDPASPQEHSGGRRRTGLSGAGKLLAALVLLMALGLGVLLAVLELTQRLSNPFATETVDRTGPAVLEALEDLSEYRAATGHFEVILDVEEDAPFLPSALRGERTLFVAVGSVEATVDFAGLDDEAVYVSEDRSAVVIRLPAAQLGDARVDPESSYVFERRRGLLDRLGSVFSDNPTSERELYLEAEERLAEAAEETDLLPLAEANTRNMLETLLRSLGFTDIRIAFEAR